MATPSQARTVKSLNKSPGGRRFVFKSVTQQIEEIEIDVFRSLDRINSEPSEGSSFLRDCLIEWRELNTAEDFISIYQEILPVVQTLPLVLLKKELIISALLSRLKMEARLSLEPIVRLIAAFSRDIQEDFLIFIPRVVDALVTLLKSGGDRDPEIIEQVFTCWSYILMHLQKYLVCDVSNVLKLTKKLRYYHKGYVQELMAKKTSFLLRNASDKQLQRGVKKVMLEAVKKPLPIWKSGVSALLYYVMRGSSSRIHSRAQRLLQTLIDSSIFSVGEKFDKGPDSVLEVVIGTFERLCEELEPEERTLIWNCLICEIDKCVTNRCLAHLSRLLSILETTVKIRNNQKVPDLQPVVECVGLLVEKLPSLTEVGGENIYSSEVIANALQLMLSITDGLILIKDESALSHCSGRWAPLFQLKNSTILTFIHGLLKKDSFILHVFRTNILSALSCLIEVQQEEVVYLLLILCERLQKDPPSFIFFDKAPEVSKISDFIQGCILKDIKLIKATACNETPLEKSTLAMLWGTVCCYSHVIATQSYSPLLMDLIDQLEKLLMVDADNIAGFPRSTWQSLIGAALSSYLKCCTSFGHEETCKVLHLAKSYKSSSQVLSIVADYLDHVHGSTLNRDSKDGSYHPEFETEQASHAFSIFADNLTNPSKEIRVATLRILCHYDPQGCKVSDNNQSSKMEIDTEASQTCLGNGHCSDVLQPLLLIETTPLSVTTSRKVTLLISKIQMGLAAGSISETYAPVVLCGILGIFHNRFNHLWNAASECLAVLISNHAALVWDKFVDYLEQCVSAVQSLQRKSDADNGELIDKSTDLVEHFNSFVEVSSDSTPPTSILSLLLQSLQRIPSLAESRSRRLIPLFFKFLGYTDGFLRLGCYNLEACKGNEMQSILKEWLVLVKHMRNPKALYQSQFLKDVLQFRLIEDNDPEIQVKALESLFTWKDEYLLPYEQNLRNLINSKRLREELTTWSLSMESGFIEEAHRGSLVPLVLRILMPKVRKLKILAPRKHASVNLRKAVLRFISEVDIKEVPLFMALLVKPLIVTKEADGTGDHLWVMAEGSFNEFHSVEILKYFILEKIMVLSLEKLFGFVHVIEEVIATFSEVHIKPFLDLLMGIVVRMLQGCCLRLEAAQDLSTCTDVKQLKDLRSLCLRIISSVLHKYDDHEFSCEFWELFFISVKPLVDNLKQHGSSSEKPSALFSCFLAMSKSYYLVQLLSRVKNLVPDIFAILTVSTASEAIISYVLKFIENLLTLDDEMGALDGESAVRSVIVGNLNEVTTSLHSLLQRHIGNNRKAMKSTGDTHVKILKLLSKYIKDPLLAGKFVDVLLPFLEARTKNSDACVECLQIIRDIIPILGTCCTKKILDAVSQLLISATLDMRLQLCSILEALAISDPSVEIVAKLIQELNATSAFEEDDLDYDIIVNAYAKIKSGFFKTIQPDHALVILSHCIYGMSSENLGLRGSALSSLVSFVEFSAATFQAGSDELSMVEKGWTRVSIERMINKFLLKSVGDAMRAGSSVNQEWFELLQIMVLKLPEVSCLHSCKALCSDDAEQDFFNNIMHQQKHRRARAILRFKNVLSNKPISQDIMNKVFFLLFLNMLLDTENGKDEHIRSACLEAVSSISAHMGWRSYYGLLKRCYQEMTVASNKQKLLSRLLCSILDQFHFTQNNASQEVNDSLESMSGTGSCGASSGLSEQSKTAVVSSSEIQAHLKTLLQKLLKLLEDDDDTKINVTLNLAVLKILKLLPEDIMDSRLPSMIHRMANKIKNRLESIRDDARFALAACLKELGPGYLQLVVGVLRAVLKRGFELHVLGYSVNFVLSYMIQHCACPKLDYCLSDLLTVVENDILGDVADQKEVDKIAGKMKETRKTKSFETLEILARSITFKSNALKKLLSPVTSHMQKNVGPKLEKKLQEMLNHIASGIQSNPSVDQTDLLIFVHDLVEDGIKKESGLKCDSTAVKIGSSRQIVGSKSSSSYLITEFALHLLKRHIKKARPDKNNEMILSMLDPFVQLLVCCLDSKYEDILSASLQCLALLVRLPLPSLLVEAENIKMALLEIAQSSLNANSPVMQACLRLLTDLLQSTKISLSTDHLRLLIQFPLFTDLERNPSLAALSLLRAIVKRKLVVPEIYDLVNSVAELMVTSQLEPIRLKSSQIMLQFLLDYRLSESYLQKQLDFLVKNLSYEYSTGREAVLEMLHVIIVKFPISFLDKHALMLYIHLVQLLANDSHERVRSMSGAVIKLLLGRASPDVIKSIFKCTLSWYKGGEKQFWSIGAQGLGFLVEVVGRSFVKHLDTVLQVSISILRSAVNSVTDQSQGGHLDDTVVLWKEAYYTLILLEKILQHVHDSCSRGHLKEVWLLISELLLHPHQWISNISNRLLAWYFAASMNVDKEKDAEMLFLLRPSRLFAMSVSLCCQLEAPVNDDTAGNVIKQNIVFSVNALHSSMTIKESPGCQNYLSTLEQHEQNDILKAFQLLDSNKGRGMYLQIASGLCNEDQLEDPRYFLVSNLLRKMGKIALTREIMQMRIVFASFGEISSKMSRDDCLHYASEMLLPLYKVCEGYAGKEVPDDLKHLAQEVCGSIRNTLGPENYVQVYSKIRKSLKLKRDKRKQEEKIIAVVNPERNAKRKLRAAEKHRAQKKRKIMTMKFGRVMPLRS